jgi:hypothetical protein
MDQNLVLFDSLEWNSLGHGSRFKLFQSGTKQLRLLEFTSDFVDPSWCEKGHIGYVVRGELEIDFQGNVVRYPEGSGIVISSGSSSGHKARPVTPTVLLFLVEDI